MPAGLGAGLGTDGRRPWVVVRFALHIHYPPQPAMNSPSPEPVADASPAATPANTPGLSARAMLKQLQERFAVFRECQPLAIGIDKQVLAAQPDIDRKTLRIALRMHVSSLRYLKEMQQATQRFDLEGKPVAEVTEEHRTHAAETLKERFRKEGEQRRAKAAAEKAAAEEARAAERRERKLNELAAKFAKR